MKSLKILSVAGWIYPDQEGGSFRVVYEACRRLAARGHEVHITTQRLQEQHPEREELDGVVVHRYATTGRRGLRFYGSTFRAVRRLVDVLHAEVGFDAVYFHHPVATFAANRAAGIRGLPRVMMFYVPYALEYIDRHTYDPRTGRQHALSLRRRAIAAALWRIDGANLRRSDRIVILSEFSRGLIRQHYPDCLAKVVKLPAGADLERFRADLPRREARRRLGLPDGPAVFFACRRLEHRMGIVELLAAARRLRDEGRDVLVLVAGRGALGPVLEAQVDRERLGEVVRLLGYVPEDELPVYYRAADCSVLPTRALEGFGLATAEALACGTPVIGTPAGATPEILEPLDPRLVTDDASAEGIYRGMVRFLDELRGEEGLAERCRAYAERHLSWNSLAAGLEQIFRELTEP